MASFFVLAIIGMSLLGTIGMSIESHPHQWETSSEGEKFDCGIQPGLYRFGGERIDKDVDYRTPSFPFSFIEKNRRDKPFGFTTPTARTIAFSFEDENKKLIVHLLDSLNNCLGRTELLRDEHFDCSSRWLSKDLPHMSAEPIVGPHGHSVKLRTRYGYLEAKKKHWMVGFLFILPGANYGTNWLRFKRIGDVPEIHICPKKE